MIKPPRVGEVSRLQQAAQVPIASACFNWLRVLRPL